MFSQKTLHFFGNVLKTRPLTLPGMMVRRAREAVSAPPHGIVTTRFGDVVFPVDTDVHILARKYFFRTHEMFLETIFRRYLRPGSVFVDIGANMGYWSAFAASLVGPTGEVHAFEPVPALHASLERLAAANPAHRFVLRNAACGAERGVTAMTVVTPSEENFANFDINIGSNSVLPHFLDHGAELVETIDVDLCRFDDHVAESGLDLDRVGLIKIDVEGYESFCFDGMPRVLDRPGRRIPILCEVLSDPQRDPLLDGAKIVAKLEARGYTCLDATTLRPIDTALMMYEENILCV
ncbi:FkbM family methyltransferase [Pinisolibacter sp.]|uniref:FkbM family methyltransferase n=1 Tax=Pinisolibacter sp. TaxID=2172024 RepID=UPI002FDDD7B5